MTLRAAKIEYHALTWNSGGDVIAHAWPLDVVSAGDSYEHALSMLDEAVRLFVETTDEMGTLPGILEEAGYELVGDTMVPPAVTTTPAVARISAGADSSAH